MFGVDFGGVERVVEDEIEVVVGGEEEPSASTDEGEVRFRGFGGEERRARRENDWRRSCEWRRRSHGFVRRGRF